MASSSDSPTRTNRKARLVRAAPYLPVSDVTRAANYYERVLGFAIEYLAGSPAEFAIVSRDGLPLMLRKVGSPITPNSAQGGTWDVFFWVDDLHRLLAELRHAGARLAYGPITQLAYGMEEFAVVDENGYVLGFGQPIT